MTDAKAPLFSIIMVTMNRVQLCGEAVRSLMQQSEKDVEFLVLVQAKSADLITGYQALEQELMVEELALMGEGAERLKFIYKNDHIPCAPGTSRTVAVQASHGDYLGFLDDDDISIAPDYLAFVREFITQCDHPPLMICARQTAGQRGNDGQGEPLWLDHDRAKLTASDAVYPDCYSVSRQDLVVGGHFCHVNALLIKREGFDSLGGFDPALYYEEDRDFFYRAVSRLDSEFYFIDRIVAHHHIPEVGAKNTASNRLSAAQKRVFQMKLYTGLLTVVPQGWFRSMIKKQISYTAQYQLIDSLKRLNPFDALWALMVAIYYRIF